MKNYRRLWATLSVGVVAVICQFIINQAIWAQVIITVLGSFIAILMFVDMVKTIRSGSFGVDLLAITAIIATLAVGEYWAALIVLLMLTGGDALEDYAAHKANGDLESLLANAPTQANLLLPDGRLKSVAVNDLEIGNQCVVRPGELVPVDGVILAGSSELDEASLTGESRLKTVSVGDKVMSGSLNGNSAFTIEVNTLAADSQYQSIIKLVKQAEAHPAHFVKMADRYAVPFTIGAYLIAGVAWWLAKDPVRFAEVLVVASPCPLILAAPVAMVSGMSRASRLGIIVKSGTTLEKMADAKTVAFDKTGTITKGTLTVAEVIPELGYSEDELVKYAASAEQQSGHILARSLVNQAGEKSLLKTTAITETTGKGITAEVADHLVKVGKRSFVGGGLLLAKTAVYISIDNEYAGAITFSDTVRPEARQTITKLNQLGIGNTIMVTGDHKAIAKKVAHEVGINRVYAEQLPADKINVLKAVDKSLQPVVMVGDGVNDAPSLASADVGIAMGATGAGAASESADMVIIKDDLTKVASSRIVGQDTVRIAREAVLIGICICTVLMLIASTGIIPAIIGAMLQEVVDTVTILYALRARFGRQNANKI